MEREAARTKAVAGTWYLGGAQLLGTGATYLLLASLTRMGSAEYGVWVLALIMVGYLSPWAGLGLSSALVRYLPGIEGADHRYARYRMARRASLLCALAIAGGLVVGADTLASAFLGGGENAPLVWLVAVLFPLEAQLLIGYSYFQALEKLGTYAALSIARHLAELLVLSALVFAGAELQTMLTARAGILLLLVCVQHFWIRSLTSINVVQPVPDGELQRFMHYGLPMIPASFIWIMIMGVDRFMLQHYGRLADVGVYNIADVLAAFLINGTRPINGMLQPRFANLMGQGLDEIGLYLRKALKYLALLLFPGAVGLTVAAQPLVELVATAEFVTAAGMLPILAASYVLIGLSNPLYHLVFLRYGGRAFLWLYPLCLLVNIGCNILLIPNWGGAGAAWATLAGFAAYLLGLLAKSERGHLKAAVGELSVLGMVLACSLGMGAVLYALRLVHPLFDGVLLVPLGIVIYVLLIRLSGLVPVEERNLLLAPLQPIFLALQNRWRILN